MRRIHITGNAGSGKTTLAHQLGSALGLPVFGLDSIVWQAGWQKTPNMMRTAAEESLISKNDWIIEGVSERVRKAADTIIFLDVSRTTSLWRCAKRNWKYLFRSRPELPEDCPEILIIPKLIKIIWGFKHNVSPSIINDLKTHTGNVYVVRNQLELDALKTTLRGHSLNTP
ncbi:hypothetical protein [Maritalea sp.]|uniref:hypothetical protein n=1 Tax=Maritalea sp. TaxID=2003361 RepID=UPI003EF683B6